LDLTGLDGLAGTTPPPNMGGVAVHAGVDPGVKERQMVWKCWAFVGPWLDPSPTFPDRNRPIRRILVLK